MNKLFLIRNLRILTGIIFFTLAGSNAFAQDAITWTTKSNGSRVADTVALEDYLPTRDNQIYQEVIIEAPGTSKQELFSRAKLAIQKTFTGSKLGTSNYDPESGIVSVNNFYDISDMTALSAFSSNPSTETYYFNALLTIIVKDDKYKIKMEIPHYSYGSISWYKTYSDFKTNSKPVSDLANSKQGYKRQRMRVLKTLNEKMLATFNLIDREMARKLDTDF